MKLFSYAGALAFVCSVMSTAGVWAQEPPIVLTIDEPGGSVLSGDAKTKGGKVKDKDPNLPDMPTLFDDGWMLSFRLAAPEAAAYVRSRRSFFAGNFETLVLEDPDGCLNLTDAYPSEILGTDYPDYTPAPYEDCSGPADETVINFFIDQYDAPGVKDGSQFCTGNIRDDLVDDDFGVLYTQSNKTYVDPRFEDGAAGIGSIFAAGPNTGGPVSTISDGYLDCYGYGTDDDLPSLVVMVNIGGAVVMDEYLNVDATRIRNMAGFLSGVHFELLDNSSASTIVAHMPIFARMMRPITVVDVNSDYFLAEYNDPVNIIVSNDGVESVVNISGITSSTELTRAVLDQFPNDFEVEIRAVVVDGIAPAFIDDMNNDGQFTAEDVALMNGGTTLLSNEAVKTVNILNFAAIVDEEDGSECAPSSESRFGSDQFLYVDLDGSYNPSDLSSLGSGVCQDGDGTSRSGVRPPR